MSYLRTWTVPVFLVMYFCWPWCLPEPAGTVIGIIWVPCALVIAAKYRGSRKRVSFRSARYTPGLSRPRVPLPAETRQYVWVRDGGRCRSCRISDADSMALTGEHLQYDHVIPWSRGGTNNKENIQLLCGPENRAKGASLGPR